METLSVQGLRKSYGDTAVLAGLTFELRRGECYGLLGPNGAGKTTLISIVAGLTRASDGTVSVMGYDVVADYRGARRALGLSLIHI